jgi:hypothetical protein
MDKLESMITRDFLRKRHVNLAAGVRRPLGTIDLGSWADCNKDANPLMLTGGMLALGS